MLTILLFNPENYTTRLTAFIIISHRGGTSSSAQAQRELTQKQSKEVEDQKPSQSASKTAAAHPLARALNPQALGRTL